MRTQPCVTKKNIDDGGCDMVAGCGVVDEQCCDSSAFLCGYQWYEKREREELDRLTKQS